MYFSICICICVYVCMYACIHVFMHTYYPFSPGCGHSSAPTLTFTLIGNRVSVQPVSHRYGGALYVLGGFVG